IKAGTARLAFINQLHTTKERVGGNPTDTARDVINPQWNNTKVVSGATKVNVYLGNNGKISFTLNTTPTTLTTADFGLTKVLEGRDWTDEDKFEFGLTSEDNAPMPGPRLRLQPRAMRTLALARLPMTSRARMSTRLARSMPGPRSTASPTARTLQSSP
ncbi:MAG: hypothetical protein ACLU0O_02075, partial [Collinsella sp.]